MSDSTVAPFSISGTRRVYNIDAVDDIAGYATVNGREIAVHHLDAAAYRAIEAVRSNPATADVSALYDAVERACPELARQEIDRLSGPKIGAILGVAEMGVRAVEADLPNADGPAETTANPSPPA